MSCSNSFHQIYLLQILTANISDNFLACAAFNKVLIVAQPWENSIKIDFELKKKRNYFIQKE